MSTQATIDRDTDAPTRPVVFISKGKNFSAVRVPARRGSENGETIADPGVRYEFAPFGRFETTDPAAIAHLRGLGSFNIEFWELGAEPGRVPPPDGVFEQIMGAVAELDDARLAELEVEEQEGHKRDVVLNAIRAARTKVQGRADA
jgi:hypothetical protein